MTLQEQNCPLCGAPASFGTFDYGKRKSFRCGNCKDFVLTTLAERRIFDMSDEHKQQLAEMARQTDEDLILDITTRPSPTGPSTLTAERIPRPTTLP